jgi:hypothetical protein
MNYFSKTFCFLGYVFLFLVHTLDAQNWQNTGKTPFTPIAYDQNGANRVVLTSTNFYTSSDNGVNWIQKLSSLNTPLTGLLKSFAYDGSFLFDEVAFVTAQEDYFNYSGSRYFSTANAGSTWTEFVPGVFNYGVKDVRRMDATTFILRLSTNGAPPENYNSRFYLSTNKGATWTLILDVSDYDASIAGQTSTAWAIQSNNKIYLRNKTNPTTGTEITLPESCGAASVTSTEILAMAATTVAPNVTLRGYRSTNGGTSFTTSNASVLGDGVQGLQIFNGVGFLAENNPNFFSSNLWRFSFSAFSTPVKLTPTPYYESYFPFRLLSDGKMSNAQHGTYPHYPNIFAIGGGTTTAGDYFIKPFVTSVDNFSTFTPVTDRPPYSLEALPLMANGKRVRFAGDFVYTTTDGKNFTKTYRASNGPSKLTYFNGAAQSETYSDPSTSYNFTNDGTNFIGGDARHIEAAGALYKSNDNVVAGTVGVYKSTDKGSTFTKINNGYFPYGVIGDPVTGTVYGAGFGSNSLTRSNDFGITWKQLVGVNLPLGAGGIQSYYQLFDPIIVYNGYFFVKTENAIWVSTNGGGSFTTVNIPFSLVGAQFWQLGGKLNVQTPDENFWQADINSWLGATGGSSLPGANVDLSLSVQMTPANPAPYSNFQVKYTITNNGTIPATGVGLSQDIGNYNEVIPQGGVAPTFVGLTNSFNQTIAPGASGSVTYYYFRQNGASPYAWGSLIYREPDVDSRSANAIYPMAVEDDEVYFIAGATNACSPDVTPPTIAGCPTSVNLTTTGTSATATWTAPTATDACTATTLTSNFNSGASFPIGSTTVTYTARDVANNAATCNFTVNVTLQGTGGGCTGNLLTNNGFESSFASWENPNGATIVTDAQAGTKAMSLCVAGAGRVYQFKTATAGTTYTFKSFAKKTGTAPTNIFIKFMNSGFSPIQTDFQQITSTTYSEVTLSKLAPTGAAYMEIGFIKDSGTGCLLADEACLTTGGGGNLSPDLILDNLIISNPTLPQNSALVFNYNLRNIGSASAASPFIVKMYISSDNVLSNDDIAGGFNTFNELLAGSFFLNLGGNQVLLLPAGNYFLLVKADSENQISESNEGNNVVSAPFTFTSVVGPCNPDLTPPVFNTCPSNILLMTTGTTQIVTWSNILAFDACLGMVSLISNFNSGASFPIGSTTVTYTARDAANNAATCSFSVTITQQGTGGCTSNLLTNNGFESSFASWENPNGATIVTDAQAGTKAMSLCPTGAGRVYQFKTATAGTTYTFKAFAKKTGTASTNIFIKFMNSGFSPIQTDFQQITSTAYSEVTISKLAPTGAAYMEIGFIKDTGTGCLLADEACLTTGGGTNPCSPDVLAPTISGCPSNISLTTTAASSTATWTAPTATDNCGTPTMSSNFFSGQSFPIGSTTVTYTSRDAANNAATCNFTVTVTQSGGGNLPDLNIINLNVPTTTIAAGSVISYSFTARNTGTVTTGNFSIKAYFSTDNVLSANDIQDGTINTGNFTPGTANVVNGASTVPASLAAGNYFLIVKIDADNQVVESNENNNNAASVSTFAVTNGGGGSGADLQVTMTADKTIVPQWNNVTYTITATNNGTSNISSAKIDIGVCGSGQGHGFNSGNLLVYASTPTAPTAGTFDFLNQVWTLTNLGAGQSGVLTIRLFTTGTAQKRVVAWTIEQSPADPDSQPSATPSNQINGNCTAIQDDEAVWTINAGQTLLVAGVRQDQTGFENLSGLAAQIADFQLFPNPASEVLNLDLTQWMGKSGKLIFINQLGKVVFEKTFENIQTPIESIDLSSFNNGQYFVKMEMAGQRTQVKRLVVSRMY